MASSAKISLDQQTNKIKIKAIEKLDSGVPAYRIALELGIRKKITDTESL